MSMPSPAPVESPSSTMPTMAVLFGITLVALGLFAYLSPALIGTGKVAMHDGHVVVDANEQVVREAPAPHAPTSLAPAAIGAVILLVGIVSIAAPNARKHAMHLGAMAGLLGTIGGLVPVMLRNNDTAEAAVRVGWMMTLASLFFLALCINSFVQARVARSATVA
ncbi:Uncharacterized protein OS=Chloracidobacterium thermophilum (strain B) GN=Cabther_B0647 PE=4 SV=1 [Gemmataceae bacterium]|nr:Uncharacterized protein OS=Chloracidobacterium thermophilum (strain B) GN=Cabther_B0647 PE=4 SV=1 [Gemmataceae bacterium]VTT97555.1 Uncharacterized protein OS=Chloracidobacterium thermophilum (strain B) GN=Cabther_B0647 PE=4 SV=1 [Gemmataceae bacterium]